MVPGFAVSARAREVLEALDVPGMQFLEFRINREPFFRFHTERRLDCLDKARSEIDYFPPPSKRAMSVHR
jgi:Immunity protein family (Imm11)